MEVVTPHECHRWLLRLVGEWEIETTIPGQDGAPPMVLRARETVRSIGEFWIVAESEGEMPGGGRAHQILTVGYDPVRNRFPGSWVGNMMTHHWVYDGELDAAGRVLTLHCEGPRFDVPGATTSYRDVITVIDDDHRTLSGNILGPDGNWSEMMLARYRRVSSR